MSASSFDAPIERSGGTGPSSSPHICPYIHRGAEQAQCEEHSAHYQKNISGCCKISCNFKFRYCHKCVLERKNPRGRVVDPKIGLCIEHAAATAAPSQSRPPLRASATITANTVPIVLNTKEIEAMPGSTPEEYARIEELSPGELYVLARLSYGFDSKQVDGELARKSGFNVQSVAEALPIIFRKLGVEGDREIDRLKKAGKLFFDAREAEQKKKGVVLQGEASPAPAPTTSPQAPAKAAAITMPVPVGTDTDFDEDDVDVELPPDFEDEDPPEGFDDDEIDGADAADVLVGSAGEDGVDSDDLAEEVNAAVPAARNTRATDSKQEDTMDRDSPEMKFAREIAKAYARARAADDDDALPHVSDVLSAVKEFASTGMKRGEIGEQFGYENNTAATWASQVSNLDKLPQSVWKEIGARPIAINFLLKVIKENESAADQLAAVKQKLGKSTAEPAARPDRTVRSVETSPTRPSMVEKQHRNGKDHTANLPAPASARVPAQSPSHVSLNGHAMKQFLPVQISLLGLGDFVDFDLRQIGLGAENAEARQAQIAQAREEGFTPAQLVLQPGMAPQLLSIKTADPHVEEE